MPSSVLSTMGYDYIVGVLPPQLMNLLLVLQCLCVRQTVSGRLTSSPVVDGSVLGSALRTGCHCTAAEKPEQPLVNKLVCCVCHEPLLGHQGVARTHNSISELWQQIPPTAPHTPAAFGRACLPAAKMVLYSSSCVWIPAGTTPQFMISEGLLVTTTTAQCCLWCLCLWPTPFHRTIFAAWPLIERICKAIVIQFNGRRG